MTNTTLNLTRAITILALRRRGKQATAESAFAMTFRAFGGTTFTVVTFGHVSPPLLDPLVDQQYLPLGITRQCERNEQGS